MIGEILSGLFDAVVFQVTVDAQWKQNAGTSRGEGRVLGVFRVVEGTAPKMSRKWTQAEVTPKLGGIRYQFIDLPVASLRSSERSYGKGDNSLAPLMDLTLLEFRANDAVVEWAILPEDVEWVRAKITGQASSESA